MVKIIIPTTLAEMTENTKACSRCGRDLKFTSEFYPVDKSMSSGLRPECRECRKLEKNQFRKNNLESMRERESSYRSRNRERLRQSQKEFYKNNKEYWSAYQKEFHHRKGKIRRLERFKERYHSDMSFRMRCNLSAQFSAFAKSKPVGGFQKMIGYKVADLMGHLESLFTPEMSWDNYGKYWEIDHIRPVSSFDLPDEIKECWALTNLRPLSVTENRRKSNKLNYVVQAERNLSDGQSLSPELERGQ